MDVGCSTCLKRKVKCDEQRPKCRRCSSLQLSCEWIARTRKQRTVSKPDDGKDAIHKLIKPLQPKEGLLIQKDASPPLEPTSSIPNHFSISAPLAHSITSTSPRKYVQTPEQRRLPKLRSHDVPTFSQPNGATSSIHSQSAQSVRSARHVNRVTEMQSFPSQIVMRNFDDPTVDLRADLWEMHRQISRFSRGVGVISAQSKIDIRSRQERFFRNIDDDAFGKTTFHTPSATAVAHLVAHAHTCDKKGHSEASWNCMVHSPLLDMALCGCGYPVGFLNW